MSIPAFTYECTACDLTAWDVKTWGYRYYKSGKEEFRMRVAMGWCSSCSALTAIEIKPTGHEEAQLVAKIANMQTELAEQRVKAPRVRSWWQFRAPKPSVLIRAESNLSDALKELVVVRQLIALMKSRQSSNRCLMCESEQCFVLPAPPFETSFDQYYPEPVPLGSSHPGCGGELTVRSDGLCFSVNTISRAYDLEGRSLSATSE